MRVLVCGGRAYDDRKKVFETLNNVANMMVPNITCIIHGGARGADKLAGDWAWHHHVKTDVFIADWDRQGPAAGPIRNQRMLDEGNPDLVVAFPGGRGTADMVRRAKAAGVEVVEVA